MNRNDRQVYDRGTSLFFPDGRIYQVEYAREAVKRSASIFGVRTAGGVVLVALRSTPSELMETESIEKLHKLDDTLGVTAADHVAGARKLVDFVRMTTQRKHLRYDEPAGVETLTKTIIDNIRESTQSGSTCPYGASLLIDGVENSSGRLLVTDSSGTPQEWKAVATGGHREDVQVALEDGYAGDLSFENGLTLAVKALVMAGGEVESDEPNPAIASKAGYEIVDEETIAELFADATADDESDETDEREEQMIDGSPTGGNTSAAEVETTAAVIAAADAEADATAGAVAVALDRIAVYPVKSLDVEFVDAVNIVKNDGLRGDHEYVIFDEDDEYANGKRERAVLQVRSPALLADGAVELSAPEMDDYDGSTAEADDRPLAYFGYPVEPRRDPAGGFPDDTEASGPAVILTGTLDAVVSWFDDVDADEMRRCLRPNLVFDASEPSWEDRLFDRRGTVVEFSVGGVAFKGVNPCQRCVVPSRDPDTGAETADFRMTFMTKHREMLPEWSGDDWFDHDFRLMVNTTVPKSSWGETLSVGDAVTVGDIVPE